MHAIAPDLLRDVRELPFTAVAIVSALGLALWLTGWWAHRFWVVLAATFGAGLAGLRLATGIGMQPIVAGLLAAVAAGALALSLARVAVFIGCGLGCWYAAQTMVPQLAEPLVCVMVGGLIGMLLFRFCMMLLTSAAGMLLMSYGGLAVAEQFARFDAVKWVEDLGSLADIGYGGGVLVGVFIQYVIERARKRYHQRKKEWEEWQNKHLQQPEPVNRKGWMGRLRKAG